MVRNFVSKGVSGPIVVPVQEMEYSDYTAKVLQTEFSPKFIECLLSDISLAKFPKGMTAVKCNGVVANVIDGMRRRMLVAFHRCGEVARGYPTPHNALGSVEIRVAEYQKTGNIEFLIDALNFLMIEFMFPKYSDVNFIFARKTGIQNIQALTVEKDKWLECVERHVSRYRNVRFIDDLIHAAAYLLFEFLRPSHPQAFFKGTDTSESPGRVHESGVITHRSNEENRDRDDDS